MSVTALLERLAADALLNSREAEPLSARLREIEICLEDAEREATTDAQVEDWLQQVDDVVYEMDDVLDEWEIANLAEADQPSGFRDKVRCLFISLCLCFRRAVSRCEISKKMKALNDRLDIVLKGRERYNFGQAQTESNGSEEFQPELSTCFITKPKVYARDSDLQNLVENLVNSQEGKDLGTDVIAVEGIRGVGKTTLAHLAYNHPQVDSNFAIKAWVRVPHHFDTLVVARRILEAFGKASAHDDTLETLVNNIKQVVEGKKFLLVLDNVWIWNPSRWKPIRNRLSGGPGSRILITTRCDLVARMMDASQLQSLGLLSGKDCERILAEIAMDGRSVEEHQKMREICIHIAKVCYGLPLVAKCVGSMLALRSVEQWQCVVEDPIWEYKGGLGGSLYRLLKLTYVSLYPVLKRCLLSCVIFSKGSLIHVDELIRIWMACGYLKSCDGYGELQSKGLMYFQMLAMRSFVQKYELQSKGLMYFRNLVKRSFFRELDSDENHGGRIRFEIHEIIYDFALYLLAGEYNFVGLCSLEKVKDPPLWNYLEKVRAACASHISEEELSFDHLERVRVLRLNDCKLQGLSQEVGKLIHLRYLNLSGNPILELPDSVTYLYNLQTLSLENCSRLCRLPERIFKLVKLRHLLNGGTDDLKQFPQGLGNLTGLWTLSEFRASRTSELGILRNLNQLQGSLSIFLPKLNWTAEEVGNADLKNKIHLRRLELFFEDEELIDVVVDALQPPPNLESLNIQDTSWKWLSNWIDNSASGFDNLKLLEFDGHGKCWRLPPFRKLPSLEKLLISDCAFEWLTVDFLGVRVGHEDARQVGWFPKLKNLHFASCNWWEEWEDVRELGLITIMPHLEALIINDCVSLRELPLNLLRHAKSLRYIGINYCEQLERRSREGSEWLDKISQISYVDFIREQFY